jgi:hypothetical protein
MIAARLRWGHAFRLLLLCLALWHPRAARADAAALSECVDRLDDRRVAELLRFTEQSLRDQRLGSSLWYSGWTLFNLTNVALGAWRIAVAPHQIERDGWLLATIGAGGFVLGASILPPPGLYAARRLGRITPHSPAQRREKLRKALALLESAADFETRNTSWVTHIGGWGYSAISVAYMYLHNLHAEDMREVHIRSWVQFAATVAGAEATIWSVPRRARHDVAELRRYGCRVPGAAPEAALRSLSVAAAGSSLSLRLRF